MDVMNIAIFRRAAAVALVAAVGGSALGCSSTVRQGRSPAYLIVEALEGASGAEEDEFSGELSSDVQTNGGVFEDLGRVRLRLGLKDVGEPGSPTEPTTNNFITVTRYRVDFRRADGRNTPGVDVPYGFDGAGTVTVGISNATELVFVLVRGQSKVEPPLKNIANGGAVRTISTLADVTFFGKDQTGNDVQVTGSISVNFADWADPEN